MSLKNDRIDLPYQDDYLMPGRLVYLDELHKIYCEQSGSGPTVLVIPGMTGDASEYADFIALLNDQFQVVTLDRRGYSRSPHGWTKSSVDEQANDVARLIDTLSLLPVLVITASIASPIAIKLLLRYPHKIRGLILHEPWLPALLSDSTMFRKVLAEGEQSIQKERLQRNTGNYEARLRFLMGNDPFESFPAEARARIFKNREMYSTESAYLDLWMPPAPLYLAPYRSQMVLTSGSQSHPFLKEMTESFARQWNIPFLEVPGKHAAYMAQAEDYHAQIAPKLNEWTRG